jgi:hypothetical protein
MIFKFIFLCLCSFPIFASCINVAEFKVRDLNGDSKSIKELIHPEKLNLISVFQTTCLPCIQEMRYFTSEEQLKKYNVIFLNSKETRQEVAAFLNKFEIKSENILVDTYGKFDTYYKVDLLPMLISLNKSGEILKVFIGSEINKMIESEKLSATIAENKNCLLKEKK